MARKILLADDSVTAQNMGRKILADAGYEVITVNNGSAALKKIGETRPDLIVLDVYMPGYSGLEVCQRIKEVGETARIPILLTVGKLEPFKPEEAKRVRADAFIVKPFEASELLSALSKLEDKVVPRSDSSKPGRFARATAAIEEGRYDKTMAADDDDSGWKSRISFPKKKKEKPPEQEIDTGEIYNPVNKDLRTTVEHKGHESDITAAPQPAHDEEHVHVGALAPEGVPKDVTPEEIAALAAAAARIKGREIEQKSSIALTEAAVASPTEAETTKSENTADEKPETLAGVAGSKKEEAPQLDTAPVPNIAESTTPATLAAQESTEKIEEKKPEHKSGPAEVMAAIAGLETEWISLPATGLGNGSWANRDKEPAEPVTMAVAAGAESSAVMPRWSAVAVAIAPEEAAISLEQEMQKAYAAFAAAESAHTATVTATMNESVAAPVGIAEPAMPEAESTPVAVPIPASLAPEPTQEIVQPLAEVSEAAADVVSAAVKELEAVAAKYEAEQKLATVEPSHDRSLKSEALESPAAVPQPEPIKEVEVKAEDRDKIEDKAEHVGEPPAEKIEAVVEETTKTEPMADISEPQVATEVMAPGVEAIQAPEKTAPVIEVPEPVAQNEVSEEKSESEQVPAEPVPVSRASTAGGTDEMAKRESETAAAWASWRKIRETGGPKAGQAPESTMKQAEESVPQEAAMAVAAGAESKPEEATNFDADPEIASIVDSVLADMRPKIVEEIARKLGKKK